MKISPKLLSLPPRFHGEAELLHHERAVGGSTEAVDGGGVAFEAGVLVPAEAAKGFDHQAHSHNEVQVTVALGSLLETGLSVDIGEAGVSQVCGATDQLRQVGADKIQTVVGVLAAVGPFASAL